MKQNRLSLFAVTPDSVALLLPQNILGLSLALFLFVVLLICLLWRDMLPLSPVLWNASSSTWITSFPSPILSWLTHLLLISLIFLSVPSSGTPQTPYSQFVNTHHELFGMVINIGLNQLVSGSRKVVPLAGSAYHCTLCIWITPVVNNHSLNGGMNE